MKQIELWNMVRENEVEILAYINTRDEKNIQIIAQKTKCKVSILKEKGMIHLFKKYQHRRFGMLVLVFAFLFLYWYSIRIWQIEVVGDFKIPITELYEELEKENVKIGMRRNALNFDMVKNNIYVRRNDIAWMGFEIKGTKAVVEFVERKNVNQKEDESGPCDIIANKSGIIHKITVKSGKKVVNVGDYVQSGDILISSVISSLDLSTRRVESEGEIWLKTWYTGISRIPYEKEIPVLTGKKEHHFQIKIGNYLINFLNSGTKFEKYDTISVEKSLTLFGRWQTGLKVIQTDFNEIQTERIVYTESQAIELAKKQALLDLKSKISFDNQFITEDSYRITQNEDCVLVEVIIECVEKTGVKKPI